jgi:protein gp37
MADNTGIEWTDATWNPVTGCDEVSPGCDHCYAKTLAERFRGTPGHYFENGFDVQLRPERLDQPLRWKRPRMIFVNSMSDLFHKDIPDEFIARVFAVMALAPQHTFQVLTKRHGRMRSLLSDREFPGAVLRARDQYDTSLAPARQKPRATFLNWPLSNVWLGVSVEDQARANLRIPALFDTPAAVRWISAEPLLGPVDLSEVWWARPNGMSFSTALNWVVVGGESGRGARPMQPAWARSLRDQCASAGVPFLFKQWGEWAPHYMLRAHSAGGPAVREEYFDGTGVRMDRVGKKAAGRVLDGVTHDGYPRLQDPAALVEQGASR